MTIECTQCHHKNPDDAEFCENCGAQLPLAVPAGVAVAASSAPVAPTRAPDNLVCPNCKAPYTVGDIFCFNCGFDLTKLPAVPVNVAAPVAPAQVTGVNPLAQPPVSQPDGISSDDFDSLLASGAPVPVTPPPAPVVAVPPTPIAPAIQPVGGFSAPAQPAPVAAPVVPNNMTLNVSGPYGPDTIEYKGRELLLGRQDVKTRVFPDVNLDDGASSRRHLSIWKETADGFFYAQDLESSNGTYLNDLEMPTGDPVQLKDGDVIKIGTRYNIKINIS